MSLLLDVPSKYEEKIHGFCRRNRIRICVLDGLFMHLTGWCIYGLFSQEDYNNVEAFLNGLILQDRTDVGAD